MPDPNQGTDPSNEPENLSDEALKALPPEEALEKALHLKNSFYARAKQAESGEKEWKDKYEAAQPPTPTNPPQPTPTQPKATPSTDDGYDPKKDNAITRYIAQGYSEAEAEHIYKNGGLNDFVKAGIEAMREKADVEKATPTPTPQTTTPTTEKPPEKQTEGEKRQAWRDKLAAQKAKRTT